MLGFERPAARSRVRRRALARAVARAPRGTPPFLETWLDAISDATTSGSRLDLRGLRRGRLPGLHGRRLGRRVHERDPAHARGALAADAVQGPDRAVGARIPRSSRTPGPQIGFLQESLRWWDHWLKGSETGIMDEPLLRAWMQGPVTPFDQLRRASRPLGGRGVVAVATHRDAAPLADGPGSAERAAGAAPS